MAGFTRNVEEIQNRLTFNAVEGQNRAARRRVSRHQHDEGGLQREEGPAGDLRRGDNSSRYTGREIKRLVREADVQIYAIGIFEPVSGRSRTSEELNGPGLLTAIAEQTGGRQFPVENLSELPDVAAKIGMELRNQYVLGYVPTNQEKDGKWRRVRISIKKIRGMPRLRSHYRLGYYAPSR